MKKQVVMMLKMNIKKMKKIASYTHLIIVSGATSYLTHISEGNCLPGICVALVSISGYILGLVET